MYILCTHVRAPRTALQPQPSPRSGAAPRPAPHSPPAPPPPAPTRSEQARGGPRSCPCSAHPGRLCWHRPGGSPAGGCAGDRRGRGAGGCASGGKAGKAGKEERRILLPVEDAPPSPGPLRPPYHVLRGGEVGGVINWEHLLPARRPRERRG